jgi:hypothetical protein
LRQAAPGLLFGMIVAAVLIFFPSPEDILLVAAIGTLIATAWLMKNSHSLADSHCPIFLLLVLDLALVVLWVLYRGVYPLLELVGSRTTAAAALLVIVLAWEILTSGHNVTNASGALFPRPARVMLFLSYVAGVAAAALFFASVSDDHHQELWHALADGDQFVRIGISIFGFALLHTLFVQRILHWRRRTQPAPGAARPRLAISDPVLGGISS